MNDHRLQDGPGDIVEAVQIRLHHSEPVLRLHPEQEIVPADARIVDQNVNVFVRMSLLPGFQRSRCLRNIAHIEFEEFTCTAGSFHQGESLPGSSLIGDIVDYDMAPL